MTGPGHGRSLGLRGAPNARHFGGLRSADGRRVRAGWLVRAEALGALTDTDLPLLSGFLSPDGRPAAVIDLRHGSEVRVAPPDRLPDGQRVIRLPVYDPEHPVFTYLAAVLLGHELSAYRQMVAEGTPGAMLAVYRWFVTDPAARAMFAAAVREIAAAPGPVLFHCSAGKDRTGWLSAVLLGVLGVPWDVIMDDYLLSNAHTGNLLAPLRARPGVDVALALPVLQARREYLQAAHREALTRYGSLDGYLRDGLGLDAATLDGLRAAALR